jgi:Protein of unknown function (DUF3750)
MKYLRAFLLFFLVAFLLPAGLHTLAWCMVARPQSWHDADWSSTGKLPVAGAAPRAEIRVFVARTGGLKGAVAHHSWIVLKRAGAPRWTRYDVVGWGSPVRVNGYPPDGRWYGNEPELIGRAEGASAEAAIPKMIEAIRTYRWRHPGDYRIWPGPNSNTFVATVLASVPELGIRQPATAIGKTWPANGAILALAPDKRGFRFSLWGVAGLDVGWTDGIELTLAGLTAAIDLRRPALELPGIGRLGVDPAV